MIIFNSQQEVDDALNEEGNLVMEGDVELTFSLVIDGDITARNINAGNIDAMNIDAGNINARNIDARNINAWNIDARNINAWDIKAWDIKAWDISAWDIYVWNINAGNIKAGDISYYASCIVHRSLKCKSIKGRRENSIHACLDSGIELVKTGCDHDRGIGSYDVNGTCVGYTYKFQHCPKCGERLNNDE